MVFSPILFWKVAAVYPRLSWTGMTTPRTDRGCGAIMPKTVEAKMPSPFAGAGRDSGLGEG